MIMNLFAMIIRYRNKHKESAFNLNTINIIAIKESLIYNYQKEIEFKSSTVLSIDLLNAEVTIKIKISLY